MGGLYIGDVFRVDLSNSHRKRPNRIILNNATIQALCEILEVGNYRRTALDQLGISVATFHRWMSEGARLSEEIADGIILEKNLVPFDKLYVKCYRGVVRAEAMAESRNLGAIQAEAADTWQAAAWFLERKHKDHWAIQKKVQLSGTVENTGTQTLGITGQLFVAGVDLSAISDEELEEAIHKLETLEKRSGTARNVNADIESEEE